MKKWIGIAGLVVACLLACTVAQAAGKPVVFAVVGGDSVRDAMEKFQPLMDYLSKKTGTPFELKTVKDYDAIVEGFKSGSYDGGIIGSGVGGASIRDIGAIPVARPEAKGLSTYRGFIIVRKDGGIKKIADLKGKTFDFVKKKNSAGDLFPMYSVLQMKQDPEKFFAKIDYAGKHEVALSRVLNKEVDGSAIKDSVFEKLAKDDPRVNKEIVVIAKSEKFPDMTHFLKKGTSKELLASVRKALLSIDKDPDGKAALAALKADRYIETTPKDFAYVQKLLKAVGR
jgi:phosphonate transport system substrate-binding protein